jgi:hypothetical protein
MCMRALGGCAACSGRTGELPHYRITNGNVEGALTTTLGLTTPCVLVGCSPPSLLLK